MPAAYASCIVLHRLVGVRGGYLDRGYVPIAADDLPYEGLCARVRMSFDQYAVGLDEATAHWMSIRRLTSYPPGGRRYISDRPRI